MLALAWAADSFWVLAETRLSASFLSWPILASTALWRAWRFLAEAVACSAFNSAVDWVRSAVLEAEIASRNSLDVFDPTSMSQRVGTDSPR